ncbi:MAG: DEAD/DEAH box helicase, partial [Gammaproteobacteria bacterium]|nr:DEAD/DEAH box helicase [Gammaproteobacteria bacterium]
ELDAVEPGWRSAARALVRRGWIEHSLRGTGPAIVPGSAPADAVTGAGAADSVAADSVAAAPVLSAAQADAVAAIEAAAGGYRSFLLQGATGSGKTEVYLRLVLRTLERGAGALVLVPEIGLTPQLLARFRARLAVPIAVLHSGLSDGERLQAWRAARAGVARVLIGTRSAVFAPVQRLGLVVVDE